MLSKIDKELIIAGSFAQLSKKFYSLGSNVCYSLAVFIFLAPSPKLPGSVLLYN